MQETLERRNDFPAFVGHGVVDTVVAFDVFLVRKGRREVVDGISPVLRLASAQNDRELRRRGASRCFGVVLNEGDDVLREDALLGGTIDELHVVG